MSFALAVAGCASGASDADEEVGVTVAALAKTDTNKKVQICHKAQTLSIAQSAISAHLKHGDKLGVCKPVCPPKCDDGNPCTSDSRLANGKCDHRTVSCDDGNPCTLDSCSPKAGCQSAPADGVSCSDGNDCTGKDSCKAGVCGGTAIAGCCTRDTACNDGNACTTDRCSNRACTNVAVDCNVADRCMAGFCNPTGGACGATPVVCDDGNPCTSDSCDAAVGCKATPTADGSACQPAGCSGAACEGFACKSATCVASVQFGPESSFNLGFPASSGDPIALSLNRLGLNQLIGAAEQQTRVVRSVDLGQPIGTSITALKVACGTGWQFDQADPGYDCSVSALGQSFRGPDGTYLSSTEFALLRVLTMTPANAIVDGTSLEDLKSLADSLSIGGGFQRILGDTYGISRTREFLPAAQVQSSILTRFVKAHPAATSGSVSISLYDALNNLTTWGSKYGPTAGGHTGIMSPSTPVSAALFGASFAVDVHGTSNLRGFQGVDLSGSAAGAMQRMQVPAGDPVGEGVVWDLSASGVGAAGVNASAQAAFAMQLFENTSFVRSCDSDTYNNCRSNTPATPLANMIWSIPTWQLESVLAFAASTTYAARSGVQLSYALGSLQIDVGQGGEPAGWTNYSTIFGIGNPPTDQYLWESTSEIAQVALHRYASSAFLAEGQANAKLPVSLDVHVTEDEVVTALLPSLAAHTSGLDQRALGDFAASNADLDFFAAYGDDGLAYLAFVSPDDPRPIASYSYAKPGFFADKNLTSELSAPYVLHAGEASHQVVRLDPGVARTLYTMDAGGGLYRLTATLNAASTQVAVTVAKAL